MDQFGPVFCSSLNGKLVRFPETFEDFERIADYAQSYRAKKKSDAIQFAMPAYTYTVVRERPYLGYPPNGYFTDFFDLETNKKLNIEESVLKSIKKDSISYQSEDKLCMMAGASESNRLWFVTQRCVANVVLGTHAICEFKKKVSLRLSGLCTDTRVDKVYSLMEPKRQEYEGKSWTDYYRYGTFSGRYSY